MKAIDVEELKSLLPLPQLMHQIGLSEFAQNSCRSPFREDKKPSWGIFQRDDKWFFKDQATGDSGDEISLLARWKGLDEKRDFPQVVKIYAELTGLQLNCDARQPSTAKPDKRETKSFAWSTCVAGVGPAEIQKLAQWRGYSPEFCVWLRAESVIGLHRGNWALPVHGEAEDVVACHYRVDRAIREKPHWFFHPKGFGARPLIFGDPKQVSINFVFESPWDAFAVMDTLGWHTPKGIPDTAVVITRGAGNGKMVAGLFSPQTTVYVFRQNDSAAEKWLADVCAHAGCKVLYVTTPPQFKDVNDWTRTGATVADIMAAIQEAAIVEGISPKLQASEREPSADSESAALMAHWPKSLEAAAHNRNGSEARDFSNTQPDWLQMLKAATITAAELQNMVIEPREFLIEPFFKVGDFGILFAQRGVGKTWLGYLIARGVSQGTTVGLWTCPKARPVLVVDGEMPLDLTKERDKQFAENNGNLFFLHHQVLFDRTGAELNLTSPLIQNALENLCVEKQVSLLILDNQSTLLAGVSETDPDSWNLIQPFLLRLQRHGIAVLLVVHAGRNNQARGHSRREDRTSWMISLTDRKEDDSEGAKFISEFTKPSRNCTFHDTPPLIWEFMRGTDGQTRCTCKILQKLDQFRQCLEEGMGDDPGAIAEAMKVSPGYVSKLATKGIAVGWCKKKDRGYMLVS